MNSTSQNYRDAHEALETIVEAVPADGWSSPSPCEDWMARDVIEHLMQTQSKFLNEQGLDVGAAPDAAGDPAATWRDHSQHVMDALGDDAAVAAPFEGFFGPSTVGDTFVQFYVWDMLVHRWDLAAATGLDAGLTEAELDRIERGADGFGEALHMEGICKPAVEATVDDRTARVLARLGREV